MSTFIVIETQSYESWQECGGYRRSCSNGINYPSRDAAQAYINDQVALGYGADCYSIHEE